MKNGSNQFRVRVDDETAAVIRKMAEETGQPASKVIGDLLHDCRPGLEAMLSIIMAASTASEEARAALSERFAGIEEAASDFFATFDDTTHAVRPSGQIKGMEIVAGGRGRAPSARPASAGRPPYTNRGAPNLKRQQVVPGETREK